MKRAPQNQQIWTTESGPLIPDARSQLLSVYPYRLAGPAYATQHPGNLNPYAQAFWNHAGVRLPPMLAGHTFSTMSAPGPQWIPGMAPSSNFGIGAPPIPYYYGMNPTVTSAQDGRELGEIVRTDKRQNTNDDTRIDSDPNKQFYEPISPPKTSHTEYEARARTLQSSLNFDRQSMHNISAFHHQSQPQPTSSFSTDYPYHRSNQNVSGPVFPQGVQTGQYSPICRGSGGVKKSENLRRKALLNSASSALTVTDSTQPPNAALDLATNVNDKGPENTSCVSKPSSDNQTTSLDLVNRQNSATSSTHTKTSHHNPGDQSNPLPQISQEELTNRYYQAMYSNLTQYDHQAILSDTYQAQLLRSMLLNSPNAQFDYSKHVLLQNLPPGDRVSHSDTTMLTQNNSTKASSRASKRTESTVNVGSSTSRQHAQVTLGTENSGPSEAVQFPRDFNYFNRLHQSEHLAAPVRVPELAPPQQNSPRKAKRGGKNSRGGRGKGLQNAGTGTPIEFLHQEAPAEPTICSSTMVSTGACTDVYHPTQSSAHLQQPKQQQQSLEQLQRQALQHQDQDQHPQQQRQHLEQQPQQQQRHHLEQQQQPQRPGQLQQSPQPEQQQQQQQQQKQQQQCKQPNQQPQRHQPEQQQQQHQQLEHEIQQHQKSELQLQQLEQEQQQRLQVREQQQHCLELSLQQHQGLKQYQQLKQLEQQPQQRQQPEQQQDQQQQDQQQQDQHQHSEQEQQQHQQPEKQLQLQHRSPHKAQQSAQIGNHQQHQQEQWQNQQDLPQSEQRRIKPHELELKRRKQLQNQQMQQQQWWTPSRPPYLMKNENRASENSQLFDLGRGSANAGQLVGNLSSESLESAKINLSDTLRDKSHSVTQTSQKPSSSSFQHNIVAKAHRKDFPSQTSTHSQETAEGSEENVFTHERVNSNIPNLQENGNVPKQKRSQNQTLQHSRSIMI
ncbi:putative uncharacterized protein DDB_G0271606 isoform X2 [Aplysia californica]|uniref:Uncharacterized protein n=1 Tax=Aplysia californica TaxID=6500 RepID=A0ABM1A112_APLCA|nr:putative uncharacterized protein DDB_G0271606 isoform X2 [Aplysia californica]